MADRSAKEIQHISASSRADQDDTVTYPEHCIENLKFSEITFYNHLNNADTTIDALLEMKTITEAL